VGATRGGEKRGVDITKRTAKKLAEVGYGVGLKKRSFNGGGTGGGRFTKHKLRVSGAEQTSEGRRHEKGVKVQKQNQRKPT